MESRWHNRARVPTPKQLSSVGVITYCQQDSDYLDFFEEGVYSTLEPLSTNPTRGITVTASTESGAAVREANTKSVIK